MSGSELQHAAEVIATRVGGTITPSGTHHAIRLIMLNRNFAGDAVVRAEANCRPADRQLVAEARRTLEKFHVGLPQVS